MNTKRSSRFGGTLTIVATIVVTVTVVGTAALIVRSGNSSREPGESNDTHIVKRGSFDITTPAAGELAALQQIEIRNRLESRAVITEIVEEGKSVKAGDVLIRLADEDIRNRIKDAVDAVNNAQSDLITAQSNLDIRKSSAESQLAQADLDVMLAGLALRAWEEGEVVSKRQQLALDLETAQKDYDRLNERYDESVKLEAQKFISRDELKRDEIDMIRAKARLDQAKLDIEVYENYLFKQQEAQKNSDVDQAKAERKRVEDRLEAELETVRAVVVSRQRQLESRTERLADLREQLEHCTVTAPSDGLVVYFSSLESGGMRRNQGQPPEVGTELRPNERVIFLPNMSQMIASVKVNEARTGLIEPGQPAIIISDAIPDTVLHGEVLSIGVLAESGGWRDPNRRDYTVKILLTDGNDLGLKPSMRCKAEIYVGRVEDVLHVPIQAVFHEGPAAYVYVPQDTGFAQRKVTLGRASELHVEVSGGLEEGDVVLLREPQAREIVARLDEPPADGRRPMGPPRRAVAERDEHRPDGEVTRKPGEKRPPSERHAGNRRPTAG